MIDYRDKYYKMTKSIENKKEIEIKFIQKEYRELSKQQLNKKIQYIEEDFNIKLPISYTYYLFPCDKLYVSWFFNLDNYYESGGELNLFNFSTVLINPLETDYKNTVSQDDAKVLKQGFRFFDRPNEIDRAAIKITNGQIEDKVYYTNELNVPQRMSISYPEYMEHIIKIKGLQHWQYLFIEGLKFSDVQFGLERELGDRLNMLKKVFNDEDFSEYSKIFDKLK
jgi:hypothetical protein